VERADPGRSSFAQSGALRMIPTALHYDRAAVPRPRDRAPL